MFFRYSITKSFADEEFTTEVAESKSLSSSHRLIRIDDYSASHENPEPTQNDDVDTDLFEEYLSPRKLVSFFSFLM